MTEQRTGQDADFVLTSPNGQSVNIPQEHAQMIWNSIQNQKSDLPNDLYGRFESAFKGVGSGSTS